MARRNCALSLRRADCRRKKAYLATAITIRRYMHPRYAVLAALVVCALRCDGAGPAAARSWPTRPLTMVVPFAPGGGTDVLGRIVGRRLSGGPAPLRGAGDRSPPLGPESPAMSRLLARYPGRVTDGVTD